MCPAIKWGERGENLTKMQKPLPVAEAMKHYVTPQKFHLELFMAEPDIQGKPIAMNWDHRGVCGYARRSTTPMN